MDADEEKLEREKWREIINETIATQLLKIQQAQADLIAAFNRAYDEITRKEHL